MLSNTSVWYKQIYNKQGVEIAAHEIICSTCGDKYIIRVDMVNGFDKAKYPLIGTWVKSFDNKDWANNYFKKITGGAYIKAKKIINR